MTTLFHYVSIYTHHAVYMDCGATEIITHVFIQEKDNCIYNAVVIRYNSLRSIIEFPNVTHASSFCLLYNV